MSVAFVERVLWWKRSWSSCLSKQISAMRLSLSGSLCVGSTVFSALPFAFALIRAVETQGRDLRYVLVALAAFVGAATVRAMDRRPRRTKTSGALLFVAAFIAATLLAIIAGLSLGTIWGPGIVVLGSAFGLCEAAAALCNGLALGG